MALPPLPQPALQNSQGRWSDFFQQQGRSMPQLGMPQRNPGLPPQAAPQAGQTMGGTGMNGIPMDILQKIMNRGDFFGGLMHKAYPEGLPQQAAPQMGVQHPMGSQFAPQQLPPQAGQMTMGQMPPQPMGGSQPMPQQSLLGSNFFKRRAAY